MSRLSSAITMLEVLSTNQVVSRESLAELLEISPRAVQRLKDDLEIAGFDIGTKRGNGGGYYLVSNLDIVPSSFNDNEITVLKNALSFLSNQDLTPLHDDTYKLLAKLSNLIDGTKLPAIHQYQSIKLNVDPIKYQRHIRILEDAIHERREIVIKYNKNHREQNEYVFWPYNLIVVNRFWYLVGLEASTERFLSLKINRMEEITPLSRQFVFDRKIERKSAVSNFGYKIKPTYLKCIITNRDYISELIWGEEQMIEWIDDHSFEFSVIFPNENAAKDFILQNGSALKILEPLDLVQWRLDEISAILAQD